MKTSKPTRGFKALVAAFATAVLAIGSAAPVAAEIKPPEYPERASIMDKQLSKCFRPLTGAGADLLPQHIQMIKEVQQDSAFVGTMFGEASKLDIIYCTSLSGVAPFAGAVYYSSYGVVGVGDMNSRPEKKTALVHETMHGLQKRHSMQDFKLGVDVGYWLKTHLYGEAAAMTLEIIGAFEQKKAGDPEAWNQLFEDGGLSEVMPEIPGIFLSAYSGAKGEGHNDIRAIEKAGAVAWNHIMQNKEWLDFYVDQNLQHFIVLHDHYKSKEKVGRVTSAEALPDKARLSGHINAQMNYTRDVLPTSAEAILEGNQKLQWAFQAVKLWQYRDIRGMDHPETLRLEKRGIIEKNPYIKLNIREAMLRKKVNGHDLTEVLDDMLSELDGLVVKASSGQQPSQAPAKVTP